MIEHKPNDLLLKMKECYEEGTEESISCAKETGDEFFSLISLYLFISNSDLYSLFETVKMEFIVSGTETLFVPKINPEGDATITYNGEIMKDMTASSILFLLVMQLEGLKNELPRIYDKTNSDDPDTVTESIAKEILNEKKAEIFSILPNKDDSNIDEFIKNIESIEERASHEEGLYRKAFFQALREKNAKQKSSKASIEIEEEPGEETEDRPFIAAYQLDFDALKEIPQDERQETYSLFMSKTKKDIRGKMPADTTADLSRQIQYKRKRQIKWQNVLRRIMGTTPYGKRDTKTRLNRRQPLRADLSGTLSDRKADLVVAVDTSGSLDHDQLKTALSEIMDMKTRLGFTMTLIQCDCEIKSIKKIRKPSNLPRSIWGMGGTSYRPVIDYINENRKYRHSVLIYFTDGYGDSSIPKPLCLKTIWVIISNAKHNKEKPYISLKETYGPVLPSKTLE